LNWLVVIVLIGVIAPVTRSRRPPPCQHQDSRPSRGRSLLRAPP